MSGKVADRLLLHCSFNSIHYGKQSTKSSCGQTRFKSCVGYSVNPVLLYAFWHSCNCLCGKSGFSLVNREKSRGIWCFRICKKMGNGIFDCRFDNFCHLFLHWFCIGILIQAALIAVNESLQESNYKNHRRNGCSCGNGFLLFYKSRRVGSGSKMCF